ncbi:MAG: hypothetical protein AAFQ89_05610 [Cyanobacteria bacterium J06626_18]
MPPQDRRFCPDQNLPQYLDTHLTSVVQEYANLTKQDILSTTAAGRIDEILSLAEVDPALNQKLVAVDQAACCRQNLLTCLQRDRYRNTLANVSEFIDLSSFRLDEDTKAWRVEQTCLRQRIDSLKS